MIPASALLAHLNTCDKDYWLGQCQGFTAREHHRRLGLVAYARFESSHVRPDMLVVRGGLFGRREYHVSVNDVAAIDPPNKTIWIDRAGYGQPLVRGLWTQRLRHRRHARPTNSG
jgi:hypothetical protein